MALGGNSIGQQRYPAQEVRVQACGPGVLALPVRRYPTPWYTRRLRPWAQVLQCISVPDDTSRTRSRPSGEPAQTSQIVSLNSQAPLRLTSMLEILETGSMRCTTCEQETPSDSKFCKNCGTSMAIEIQKGKAAPTAQQIALLGYIRNCQTSDPPFTPTGAEIAAKFGTNRSTAQQKIDRLARQGWIEKLTTGLVPRLRLTQRGLGILEESGMEPLNPCCIYLRDAVRVWGYETLSTLSDELDEYLEALPPYYRQTDDFFRQRFCRL